MINRVPIQQVFQHMNQENPWWQTSRISKRYEYGKRAYFDSFFHIVRPKKPRRATVLIGPRRVGKTVMMHQVIQQLIEDGVEPKKICYFKMDSPIYNLSVPLELMNIVRDNRPSDDLDGYYFFFDEIQYLSQWELHLKDLVDTYHTCEFIVSGSAAAALNMKSKESGAGRFTDFFLPPLSFYEYITMIGREDLVHWDVTGLRLMETGLRSTDLRELNEQFLDYLNFGGYPELIFSEEMRKDPSRYVKTDILDKVLLRDLPSLYGISDVQELYSFFTMVAFNSGEEFSPKELSQSTNGVSVNLISKYLEYLESAFLVKKIRRVDMDASTFKRDVKFKLHLTNPSIRSALFSPLTATSPHIGSMVETVLYAQLIQRPGFNPYYARWARGEVDMVLLDREGVRPRWALEIKWSDRFVQKPHELKSLITFCKKNKMERAFCTSINFLEEKEVDGVTIRFVPAAIHAFILGYNTVQRLSDSSIEVI